MFETSLRDGTPVVVRPVTRDDKPLLVDGFRRLSEESRYRRFMSVAPDLTEAQIRYLTEIDYWDHFAWGMVRADDPTIGIGVGRYVRLKEEPEVAEPAIAVADDYQGKGAGTLLLALVAVAAWAAGIRTVRAYVLEENEPMRVLLDQLGAEVRHDSPGLVRVDVPVDPGNAPDTPAGRVLRAAARNLLRVAPPEEGRRRLGLLGSGPGPRSREDPEGRPGVA